MELVTKIPRAISKTCNFYGDEAEAADSDENADRAASTLPLISWVLLPCTLLLYLLSYGLDVGALLQLKNCGIHSGCTGYNKTRWICYIAFLVTAGLLLLANLLLLCYGIQHGKNKERQSIVAGLSLAISALSPLLHSIPLNSLKANYLLHNKGTVTDTNRAVLVASACSHLLLILLSLFCRIVFSMHQRCGCCTDVNMFDLSTQQIVMEANGERKDRNVWNVVHYCMVLLMLFDFGVALLAFIAGLLP